MEDLFEALLKSRTTAINTEETTNHNGLESSVKFGHLVNVNDLCQFIIGENWEVENNLTGVCWSSLEQVGLGPNRSTN